MAATASLPRFGGLAMMRPHENPAPRFRRPMAKRVTWASSDHLCQVRMFLAEDAPFRAGLPQGQEELQGKTPRFLQRSDDLPPGFGGGVVSCLKNDSKNDAELVAASVVAAIPWKSPQKIELDPSWNVEAGGGSSEIEVQKQRESKTLEAVYPRSSAIPSSPLEAPIESHPTPDDRSIFVIPVSSPDDDSDDGESEISRNKSVISSSKNSASTGEQSYCGGGAATANSVAAAAAAAAAAALSQAAVASAIDPNLLLQLLANPSLVETLSGVRNNSLVNTSNGNGSVPPNQVVAGVKNLTSNSTVSTATTSAAISSSPPSQNVSSSMGFTDAGYTPSHRFVAPPPSSSSSSGSSASIPGSGSGSGSGPASAASSAPSPWVSPYQVQTQASVSTSDGGAGIYGGYKNPSTMMRHQHQQQQQQQQQFMLPNSQQQQQQQQQQNSARPSELSYFKELIMQHGGKGGGGGQGGYYSNGSVSGMNQSTMTGSSTSAGGGGQVGHATGTGMGTGGFRRSNRTCAYFNTPKGCRNGPKCPFVHDSKRSGSELTLFQHQQQAKRMRG